MPSTPANDSTTMSGISKGSKINIGRHCSKECCTLLVTIVNKGFPLLYIFQKNQLKIREFSGTEGLLQIY
jgi:hypothetical protein